MPELNGDPTKKNYEAADAWHSEKSKGYDWSLQRDLFSSNLPKGARILDVGAGGSGRDIADFVGRGFVVEGLDYSAPAIASLRQQFPNLKSYEADMRSTGLENNSYQGIWACASILNIPKSDIASTLQEFRRLLQDGGQLFISVKKGEGERMVPDQAGERFFNFFSESELRELAETAGFVISRSDIVEDSQFTGKEAQPPLPAWICLHAVKA